jgi:hypothetical protein
LMRRVENVERSVPPKHRERRWRRESTGVEGKTPRTTEQIPDPDSQRSFRK